MPYRPNSPIRTRISGTLTAVAYSKDSDPNTGINFPDADQLAAVVGGVTAAHWTTTTAAHPGVVAAKSATAPAAGGAQAVQISNVGALGIYFGTGAPSVVAGTGSWYMNQNGSSTQTRAYVNTGGGTYWTAIVTVA